MPTSPEGMERLDKIETDLRRDVLTEERSRLETNLSKVMNALASLDEPKPEPKPIHGVDVVKLRDDLGNLTAHTKVRFDSVQQHLEREDKATARRLDEVERKIEFGFDEVKGSIDADLSKVMNALEALPAEELPAPKERPPHWTGSDADRLSALERSFISHEKSFNDVAYVERANHQTAMEAIRELRDQTGEVNRKLGALSGEVDRMEKRLEGAESKLAAIRKGQRPAIIPSQTSA